MKIDVVKVLSGALAIIILGLGWFLVELHSSIKINTVVVNELKLGQGLVEKDIEDIKEDIEFIAKRLR